MEIEAETPESAIEIEMTAATVAIETTELAETEVTPETESTLFSTSSSDFVQSLFFSLPKEAQNGSHANFHTARLIWQKQRCAR